MKMIIVGIHRKYHMNHFIGPPLLKKNVVYKIIAGEKNVIVDFSLDPPAFPPPKFLSWNKTGVYVTLKNSAISFDTITRKHSGTYSLTATNYHLDDNTKEVGTDTGNFTLDVVCKFDFQLTVHLL